MNRKQFLSLTSATTLAFLGHQNERREVAAASKIPLSDFNLMSGAQQLIRQIPSSGEKLPAVGLGTWQAFDYSIRSQHAPRLEQVLLEFKRLGGRVIDSSPMYGRAEELSGYLAAKNKITDDLFIATKVWTNGRKNGLEQMKRSAAYYSKKTIDLMQVHNLRDYSVHYQSLQAMKKEGLIRYTGITHYVESAFDDLAAILKRDKVDFVQLPYSIALRSTARRLLPLCQDRGVGVLVNRPFEGGHLFNRPGVSRLPEAAAELGIRSPGQLFLKYILAHPAVTCVIPGTGKLNHLRDNLSAMYGPLPDGDQRKQFEAWFDRL